MLLLFVLLFKMFTWIFITYKITGFPVFSQNCGLFFFFYWRIPTDVSRSVKPACQYCRYIVTLHFSICTRGLNVSVCSDKVHRYTQHHRFPLPILPCVAVVQHLNTKWIQPSVLLKEHWFFTLQHPRSARRTSQKDLITSESTGLPLSLFIEEEINVWSWKRSCLTYRDLA